MNKTDVTLDNYVDLAGRTDTPITEELLYRLTRPGTVRLLHAGMGMCTEAGEFLDILKRHIFYGKEIDYANAKEELGDEEWYIALAIDEIRTTMKEVLTLNIEKLKHRYPTKFNEEHAINRNLQVEQSIFEEYNEQRPTTMNQNCPVCLNELRQEDAMLIKCTSCGAIWNDI